MNKAVVIGGSGFIGSHVTDSLVDNGYSVTVFDKVKSPWIINKKIKMVIGDILDVATLDSAISGSNLVYNFAGIADLNSALNKPKLTAELNIIGNLNIMQSCIKHNIDRFIFASTIYVNSNEGGFYRCSKVASEQYIEEFNKNYGLNYTVLRYGSLYGPRADSNNGIVKILEKAIYENVLVYDGHVDTKREYIHVIDAAEAAVKALNKEFENKTITLTGQQNIKVIDLLKMIGEILNIPEEKIKVTNKPQVGHYIHSPYAQTIKLPKKLVPNNYIDLGEGILQLINILKNNKM